MQELEIQKLIRSYSHPEDAIDYLKGEPLNLKINQDGEYYVFNYNMIESPKSHPIIQEARGLILESTKWDIMLYPMRRFFNYGELDTAGTLKDLNGWAISSKEDGSMVSLWCDKNWKWQLATRSTPFGTAEVGSTGITFDRLFFNIFPRLKLGMLKEHITYSFELCTDYNKVVTRYEEPKIFLIAARDRNTGDELNQDQLNDIAHYSLGVSRPTMYFMNSLEDILKAAKELPAEKEGYVIFKETDLTSVHAFYERLKLKNPAYVALHHIRSSASIKNLTQIICGKGEIAELITYFPEYKEFCEFAFKQFNDFCEKQEKLATNLLHRMNDLVDFGIGCSYTRKEQAFWIQEQTPHSQYLFSILTKGYVTAKEYYSKVGYEKPDRMAEILGLNGGNFVFQLPDLGAEEN